MINKETSDKLKEMIEIEIKNFVKIYESKPDNHTKWGIPIVGFADAKHPYILSLKDIISTSHQMPTDVLSEASIVIAYYLPFTRELAKTNVSSGRLASFEWTTAYEQTNEMFNFLNIYLIEFLRNMGYKAMVSKETLNFDKEKLISNWSHRHFAYAAGLGTFGMNNMLISKNGCCGRYFTIVTNLDVIPDAPMTNELCLYKSRGTCGICFKNCPMEALSALGYKRERCHLLIQENEQMGGSDVCGKCITASPCAFGNI